MIQYRFERGVFPPADSAEFWDFFKKENIELENITLVGLKGKIGFLKHFYQVTVEHRGENAHFFNSDLQQRFDVAKMVWGRRQDIQDGDVHRVFFHPFFNRTFISEKKTWGPRDINQGTGDDRQECVGENAVDQANP